MTTELRLPVVKHSNSKALSTLNDRFVGMHGILITTKLRLAWTALKRQINGT
jgi:hypothetical protein